MTSKPNHAKDESMPDLTAGIRFWLRHSLRRRVFVLLPLTDSPKAHTIPTRRYSDLMSVKERIFEATAKVADEEGPARLTLERVAEVAGVSKGGLLYHFPTKNALLQGVIEYESDKFEAAVQRLVDEGVPFLEAYVDVVCETHRDLARVAPALLATAAVDRSLLAPFRTRCDKWNAKLSEYGVSPGSALAAMLLGDGLLVGSALGVVSVSDRELAELKRRMLWILRPTFEEELAETAAYALAHADEAEGVLA
jgi:AcrR family transcriptional regulator